MEGTGEVTREKTRIYVGGLAGGVTEDDLRKTFSALGEVVAVDVVRTKGRSFAYLDFLPSSDKSLPKLFSTYNGCMWKGGKLRLEKAKEHYLIQLRREWQEDSENASKPSDSCNDDVPKSDDTLEKSKKPSPTDKTQFHLFFPKLGKVKSLAQVGIGKHKYSFQRIQVPSIPTHFCDCEEHSLPYLPINKNQSSELKNASDDGINEQELNIMNSVMNRIFEKANPSKQVMEKPDFRNANDDLVGLENDEDQLTDEDNLIINVANGNSDSMDLLGEMRTMMENQEPVAKRRISSSEKLKSMLDSHQKKPVPLSKKRKSPHSEKNNGDDIMIPKTPTNSQTRLDTLEDSKTKIESGTKRSESNSLRSLKSTWKDLIGQKRNTSFSISDFIAKENEFTKNTNDASKKKNKKSGEGDQNKEPTTEISSIPDIIANECQQKEEEHRPDDIDLPLTTIGQQPSIPDVLADVSKDLIKTARGEFWRHKSSWAQLISNTSHTSFSISQIVPNLSFEKPENQADTSESQLENKDLNTSPSERVNDQMPVVKKSNAEQRRILSLGSLESEGTCSFMRTEESMKEWKKAKASLSGSLNKKKKLVNESG